MDACPGHILESTKEIEMKLGLQIDDSDMKGSAQEPYSYPVYLQSYLPLITYFFIMDACLGHILESTKEIEMKLGLQIDSSEGKGSTPKR